jgi:transcriptional antiterminator
LELKSRLVYILKSISESENGKSIDSLLEELEVTKRTLYYDLEKINDWLLFNHLGKTVISGHKVNLLVQEKEQFEKLLSNTEGYYFSIVERRAMEFLYITLSHDVITIEKLRDFFDVSKNTILTDIKELKRELEQWNFAVMSTMKTGYYIEGDESSIRKVIGRQLQILSNPGTRMIVKRTLNNSLVHLTGNDIDFFEISRCVIKQYEKDIDGQLFLSDIDIECMLMQVSWIRCMKGYTFDTNSDEKVTLMNTASYRSLKLSLQKLVLHNMNIPNAEIYYLIPLFLGIKTADFVSREQEDFYIKQFAEELVKNFERVSCISFVDKERLYNRLSFHIRPLYYRLKYGMVSSNPLVENIKNMYPYVYDFTKRALKATNSDISQMIVEDEVAYLCVYFASHLNQKKVAQYEGERKGKILIVGGINMAVSMLVQEQLLSLFSDSFIYEKTTASNIKEWMLNDYLLVVTTVPLKKHRTFRNVVCVEPFIKDISWQKIITIIEESGAVPKYDSLIRKVIGIAEQCCTGEVEQDKMYFDLFRFFYNEERSKTYADTQISIIRKLERSEITCCFENAHWKDVLEEACKKIRGKYFHRRTYERILNLLQLKKGKIYQLNSDVILVRCPMQGEIHSRVNISIFVSEDGITFPEEMTGKIIIFLSTIDNYSHWSLLREIYSYFETQEHIKGILESFCQGGEE